MNPTACRRSLALIARHRVAVLDNVNNSAGRSFCSQQLKQQKRHMVRGVDKETYRSAMNELDPAAAATNQGRIPAGECQEAHNVNKVKNGYCRDC